MIAIVGARDFNPIAVWRMFSQRARDVSSANWITNDGISGLLGHLQAEATNHELDGAAYCARLAEIPHCFWPERRTGRRRRRLGADRANAAPIGVASLQSDCDSRTRCTGKKPIRVQDETSASQRQVCKEEDTN